MANPSSREEASLEGSSSPISSAVDGLQPARPLTGGPSSPEAINRTEAAAILPLAGQPWPVDVLTGLTLGDSEPWALPWLLGRS